MKMKETKFWIRRMCWKPRYKENTLPKARVNGIDINYIERGEGTPFLLVHGFQNSHFSFTPLIDWLADRFHVYALDLRGHGDSDKPRGPYTIQTFADDVVGFLDALGVERTDYLGQSMGGRTGTMVGIQHPERLSRLMLSAASAGPPSGAYRQMFEENLQVAETEGMEALHEYKLRRDEIPESLREGPLAEEYRERYLKNTPQTFADTANALFTMPVLRDELHRISVPTWVCHGENDAGPISFSEVYAKGVPDCTTSIIPDAGHSVFWDQPGAFIAQMEKFLEKNPL